MTQWLLLIDMRTQLKIMLIAVAKNNFLMTSRLEKIWFHTRRKKSFFWTIQIRVHWCPWYQQNLVFLRFSFLRYSLLGNVGVVAEDVDILVILIHHFDVDIYKELKMLTSKGHYSVNEIVNNSNPDVKLWILFCHSFSSGDTVSSIFGVN